MAKNIEVTLTLDSKQFNKGMSQAKSSMKGFGSQGKVATGAVMGLASRLIPLAAAFLAVKASVDTVSKSLSVSAQFEDVGIVLENIVGSAAGGAAALNMITEAAEKLPFAFEDLAGAAPALATVSGTIGDLEDNMMLAADLAANFGIPFEVAAGQLQRSFSAGAGAADVFREKGVLAAAGFEAGVTYSIEETQKKLAEFGATIEGASQKLNTSFNGAVSQAGDAMTLFQKAIGDAFRPEATVFLNTLTAKFRENKKEIMAFATAIGQNALKGFIGFLRAGATVVDMMTSIGQVAKRIGQGFRQNFGEQIRIVANFLTQAFGLIVEGIGYVGQGIGKLIEVTTGVDSVTTFFENMTEAANELRTEGLDAIEDVSEGLGTFIPNTTARDAIDELVADFTAGGQEIRTELGEIAEAAEEMGRETEISLNKTGDSFAQMRSNVKDFAQDLLDVFDPDGGAVLGMIMMQGNIGMTTEEMQKLADASGITLEQLLKMGATIGIINETFNNNIVSMSQYNQMVKLLEESLADAGFQAQEIMDILSVLDEKFKDQEGLASFLDTIGSAQKALSQDLATALVEGQSAGEAFQSFFKKLVVQLIADALRLAIIQPILGSLFGVSFGTGGAISGLTGGGLFGAFGGGKANGGPVMKNRPYIVGEKGAEAFIPSTNGTIIPNNMMGGMVTYNINAVDAPSFQQLVAQDPEFIYAVTEAGRRRLPR